MTDSRPGRPRKWTSNAERMRAYRAVERERREAVRGHHDIAEMAERIVALTAERDRLWQQVVRSQQRIAQLENALADHALEPTPATPGQPRLSGRHVLSADDSNASSSAAGLDDAPSHCARPCREARSGSSVHVAKLLPG
jgi:hypothetical protein